MQSLLNRRRKEHLNLEASWSWANREIRFQSRAPWKQPSLASSQATLLLWAPTRTFLPGHVWVVNNLPTVQETWVRSLGREDPQEKQMATHYSILAWRIPWAEEPGRLQSMGLLKSQTQFSDQTTATSLKLRPKTAQQKKVKTQLAMFQFSWFGQRQIKYYLIHSRLSKGSL